MTPSLPPPPPPAGLANASSSPLPHGMAALRPQTPRGSGGVRCFGGGSSSFSTFTSPITGPHSSRLKPLLGQLTIPNSSLWGEEGNNQVRGERRRERWSCHGPGRADGVVVVQQQQQAVVLVPGSMTMAPPPPRAPAETSVVSGRHMLGLAGWLAGWHVVVVLSPLLSP